MRVYIASSLENIPVVRALGVYLRTRGHSITYDWTVHGAVYNPERSPAENHEAMRAVSEAELGGIALADSVIMLLKGGRGTHVELGAALALNKPVLIVGREADHYPGKPCAFYRNRFVKMISGHLDSHAVVDELESFAG